MQGQRNRVRLHNRKPKRVRVKDLWEPQWDSVVKGWTRKFILQNRWRTETINDIDDLMQDAYIVFMKVRDTYPMVVEAPLFMRLYQTALWRKFMDKGRKLKNDILVARYMSQEISTHMPEMKSYNEGPLKVLLMDGPPEIKMLLDFLNNDDNLKLLCEPQRKRRGYTPRQNIDQRLSYLLGIPSFPFRDTLRRWLFA